MPEEKKQECKPYEICESSVLESLEELVNELIVEGYIPVGGILKTPSVYCQAMVKKEVING